MPGLSYYAKLSTAASCQLTGPAVVGAGGLVGSYLLALGGGDEILVVVANHVLRSFVDL